MIGKLCVMKVDSEYVWGQAITRNISEYLQTPLSRFPETPRQGDVFEVDYSYGNVSAVVGRTEEKFFEIEVVVRNDTRLKNPIIADTEEGAIASFTEEVKRRPHKFLKSSSSEILEEKIDVLPVPSEELRTSVSDENDPAS